MSDFAAAHKGTARAGGYVHIPGYGDATTVHRPRGLVSVDHDSKTYFYRVSRKEAGRLRLWVESTFLANDGSNRLAGSFPEYVVVNR